MSPDYGDVMNVVHSYPERIDAGDFEGVGQLLAHATLDMGNGELLHGAAEIQASFETWTRRLPDDGTPHTRHCVTNPIVEIDEEAGRATVRYYMTVLQRTDTFPLQPVWANRYEDKLERVDGEWRIVYRTASGHLPGDTREHLLRSPEI